MGRKGQEGITCPWRGCGKNRGCALDLWLLLHAFGWIGAEATRLDWIGFVGERPLLIVSSCFCPSSCFLEEGERTRIKRGRKDRCQTSPDSNLGKFDQFSGSFVT